MPDKCPGYLQLRMGGKAAARWIADKKAEEVERKNRPSDSDVFARMFAEEKKS